MAPADRTIAPPASQTEKGDGVARAARANKMPETIPPALHSGMQIDEHAPAMQTWPNLCAQTAHPNGRSPNNKPGSTPRPADLP